MKGSGRRGIFVVSDAIPPDEVEDDRDVFECQICIATPRNSVLTTCGHLFCWLCLHMWLRNEDKPCPSCKLTLTKASIIPVYGCQRGGSSSSTVESSIPPRPSAPLSSAPAPTQPNTRPVSSLLPRWPMLRRRQSRHSYLEFLRTRARADFRAIRQLHPPSPTVWIAEASERFDPSVRTREDGVQPTHDTQSFVSNVLIPQGEYCPGIHDFRLSWLQYYEARIGRISPPRSALQHYDEFLQLWGMHFYEAWDRAGRPDNQVSVVEVVSRIHGARQGRTRSEDSISASQYASAVNPMEVELEVSVDLGHAAESRRIVSGESSSGRENRRTSRRSRLY